MKWAIVLSLLLVSLALPAAAAATLRCGGEIVTLAGTPGDDLLVGTPGKDVIYGGEGNDRIRGRGGEDYLCGGPGDDNIVDGPDTGISFAAYLNGGSGNDALYPNTFSEAWGGNGNDSFSFVSGDHRFYGGPGSDTVRARASTVAVTIDLRRDPAEGAGTVYSVLGLAWLYDFENAIGSQYDDEITGNLGRNVLQGLAGDDEIAGRGGNDRLFGGSGDDLLFGGNGDDYVNGGAGIGDWLEGGDGTDTCVDDAFIVGDECEIWP